MNSCPCWQTTSGITGMRASNLLQSNSCHEPFPSAVTAAATSTVLQVDRTQWNTSSHLAMIINSRRHAFITPSGSTHRLVGHTPWSSTQFSWRVQVRLHCFMQAARILHQIVLKPLHGLCGRRTVQEMSLQRSAWGFLKD